MRYFLYKYWFFIFLSISSFSKASSPFSPPPEKDDSPPSPPHYSILLVEEGAHSLGFYDSKDGKEYARVALSSLPHEITLSEKGDFAYVPNFGLRDYDLTIGNAGNSISVIDLKHQCEIYRLYTTYNGENYWAPHGIKIKNNKLYVNVECTSGRSPDPTAPLGQQTKILVFDLSTFESIGKYPSLVPPMVLKEINLPRVMMDDNDIIKSFKGEAQTSYSVLSGAHNFVFSPADSENDLWYYAGLNGVCCINSADGIIKLHFPTNRVEPHSLINFNGAVRGISFNKEGNLLAVAAYNEVTLINTVEIQSNVTKLNTKLKARDEELKGPHPNQEKIKQLNEKIEKLKKRIVPLKINNLGVGQLFYPRFTPGTEHLLVPAPYDNQVLVINTDITQNLKDQERVLKRIVTGVDPLQVMISPVGTAFVTNADSPWVTEIDLQTFDVIRDISTHQTVTAQGGPNGMALTKHYFPPAPTKNILKLGTCLPLTGEYAMEARECRLGLQFWEQMINAAGGVIWQGERHYIKIIYEDTESSLDEDILTKKVDALLDKGKKTCPNEHDGIVAILGTYPPLANKPIAQALKRKEIPFITSTGRDFDLFEEKGYVFGISPVKHEPESDLVNTLKALFLDGSITTKPQKALILACDHADSEFEAKHLSKYILKNDLKVLLPDRNKIALSGQNLESPSYIKYSHDRKGINDLIALLSSKAHQEIKYWPDILFIVGHRQESLEILKACEKHKFIPAMIALNTGIINPTFATQLGSLAHNLLGSAYWWDSCSEFAHDRFVSSSDFQRNFSSIYGQNPSELVAGFAASGIVFEEAVRQQRSKHKGKTLRDAISILDFPTFFGPIQFDETGKNKKKEISAVRLERAESILKTILIWPK